MPKTNYRECWWLVQVVAGDFGDGSYKKGTGYSMRDLVDLRTDGGKINQEVLYDYDNVNSRRIREEFRQSLIRWRTTIYNEFGLAILMESTSGTISGKGEGGYYYYLANPELLNEKGKTLKDHIKYLAKSETNRDSWLTVGEMSQRFKGTTSSMGYLSAGVPSTHGYLSKEGTSYRTIIGEENLEIIQFAMQFGEVLTIKYGKVRAGNDINAPYSLEPYLVKEIEGRWFVIGNLYPLGHKEQAELAVYDLARLQFADEENPDVLYEPIKGFGINNGIDDEKLLDDIYERTKKPFDGDYDFVIGEVYAIDITTHTKEFAEYISEHPLCSSQERTAEGTFRIYIRVTMDLIFLFGAYGAELSFNVIPKDNLDNDFREFNAYIIQLQLNYFRNIRE